MDRGQSQGKRKRIEEEGNEGASTSSAVSSAATGVGSDPYDVFLSFRGSDTRNGFTDHLHQGLVNEGIVPMSVFKDDKSIPIGEEFSSQIFGAITRSKISIPIISENYASSKWCLLELILIMDHKKSSSHIVLPIFYKVAPSDVRYIKGNFGEAFHESEKHFNDEDIQKAKQALREVSDLQGLESSKVANGREGELIKLVVKTVLSKLQNDFQLDIPRELVGLDDHLRKIINWIRSPSVNARMFGIYGMGGIGKTTLAKCIVNQLSNEFERVSFLPDVREIARRHGITHLQNQLISDILKYKSEVTRFDDGIHIIKSRFKAKKVLIVLDDVDEKEQLNALAREPNWFGEGSLIIITTRNKDVLLQSDFEVDDMHELHGLNEKQSLRLFNRHAFRTRQPYFEDISHDIISTMGGLPLALVVVGSSLYQKKDRKIWEETLGELKTQPHDDVTGKLRISYDALEKEEYKQIFVDIACYFIGENRKFPMYMWEGCRFSPNKGIDKLESRCLIKIGDNDTFEMHDQLRDLGRSIFLEGQPLDYRGGPWDDNYKGVPRVLRYFDYRRRFHDLMSAALIGDKDLSEVRWLQWEFDETYSSLSMANLRLPNLAVLQLRGSDRIREDWEGWSWLGRASPPLRVLDLSYCHNLRSTPDLSAFTQLKILKLNGCFQLEHLHPSIGELKSLVSLDLSFCESLKELPEEVGELKDLEELYMYQCKSLRGIPSSIGRLKSLRTLNLYRTPISDLPKSIRNLSSLQRLDLSYCSQLRSVPELPSSLADLSVSSVSLRLPQLCSLIDLERLRLEGCHLLEDITDLPSRLWKPDGFRYLEVLSISKCSSIEILDLSELVHLKRLTAWHCNNLVEIRGLDNLKFLEDIGINCCNSIKNLLYPKSECLKEIVVWSCDNLVEIQGPVHGAMFLEKLRIAYCESLETLPDLTGCEKLRHPKIQGCKKLTQIQGYRWDSTNWSRISG